MKIKYVFKIVSVALALCIFASVGVCADGLEPTIYGEEKIDVSVGGEFEYPIYIKNNPGISGFVITLKYDADVLEPVENSQSIGVESLLMAVNPRYLNRTELRAAAANVENFYGDGKLFSYKFKVKDTNVAQTNIEIVVEGGTLQRFADDYSTLYTDCASDFGVINISRPSSPSVGPSSPSGPSAPAIKKPVASFKENSKNIKYIAPAYGAMFEPDRAATRYEVAQALYNLIDFENLSKNSVTFSDMVGEYGNIINPLAQTQIINGYPDGTFRGDESITRAEFVKMVSVAAKIKLDASVKTSLVDVDGHWADEYISPFVSAGYIYGYPDSTFKPDENITRAEVVAIINRVISKEEAVQESSLFDDVDVSHWAYGEIMSAAIIK